MKCRIRTDHPTNTTHSLSLENNTAVLNALVTHMQSLTSSEFSMVGYTKYSCSESYIQKSFILKMKVN